MHVQALIIWLIVGAIAGWLAGMVVKGGGYYHRRNHRRLYRWLAVAATRHCDRGWSSARLFCCSFCAWLNELHRFDILKVLAGRLVENHTER